VLDCGSTDGLLWAPARLISRVNEKGEKEGEFRKFTIAPPTFVDDQNVWGFSELD